MSLFKPADKPAYRSVTPPEIRFWKHVTYEPNSGCWLWCSTYDGKGYGTIYAAPGARPSKIMAHRLSYHIHCGPVSTHLDIDHKCFNRACVNPQHLDQVTRKENILRGARGPNRNRNYARLADRTHCKRGHEFTPETTHLDPKKNRRTCKICRRMMQTANRRSKRNVHV